MHHHTSPRRSCVNRKSYTVSDGVSQFIRRELRGWALAPLYRLSCVCSAALSANQIYGVHKRNCGLMYSIEQLSSGKH